MWLWIWIQSTSTILQNRRGIASLPRKVILIKKRSTKSRSWSAAKHRVAKTISKGIKHITASACMLYISVYVVCFCVCVCHDELWRKCVDLERPGQNEMQVSTRLAGQVWRCLSIVVSNHVESNHLSEKDSESILNLNLKILNGSCKLRLQPV